MKWLESKIKEFPEWCSNNVEISARMCFIVKKIEMCADRLFLTKSNLSMWLLWVIKYFIRVLGQCDMKWKAAEKNCLIVSKTSFEVETPLIRNIWIRLFRCSIHTSKPFYWHNWFHIYSAFYLHKIILFDSSVVFIGNGYVFGLILIVF